MRSSICKSLEHLGAELYSSPVHFLFEMIQNADDNKYLPTTIPEMVFIINEDHLLIKKNEIGFTAKNVHSVCCIGNSSKTAGVDVGQKGLGFKSIFSCTDNPLVVSGVWQFGFTKGEDAMSSYITPQWYSELPVKTLTSQTNFYLPLKPKCMTEDFFKGITDSIDYRALINLKKLKKFIVENNTKGVRTKNVLSSTEAQTWSENSSFHFSRVTKKNVTLETETNGAESKKEEFIVYEFKFNVPVEKREDESSRRDISESEIVLGFPRTLSTQKQTFPVCAFLPVCNIGFPFLLNCDWILVTNRESIRENTWNEYMRDISAKFFCWVLDNDEYVKNHLQQFLPTITPEMSAWWSIFVTSIRLWVKRNFSRLMGSNNATMIFRLANNKFYDWLGDGSQLAQFGIRIIEDFAEEMENVVEKLDIKDILSLFPSKAESTPWTEYANMQPKKWWQQFFTQIKMAIQSGEINLEAVQEKPIFLINDAPLRTFIPQQQVKFVAKRGERLWRKCWTEIGYTSGSEEFIVKSIAEEQSVAFILSQIYAIHQESLDKTNSNAEEVFQDLRYVMDHQKAFVELVTTKLGSTEHLSQTLMIPTATGQFKRANEMCLSTVLGVLLPLDRASIPNSVQRLTRQQNTVQWELFLTEIGVNIPRFLRESKMCYELPSLDSFSPQATKAAVKLLKKCSTDVLVYLSCQNILACTNTDTSKLQLVPVQQVIDSGLAEFPLPHIRVEIEKRELAKLLRISIEPSSELIFKALAMLVSKKETQVSLYTPWLLQLQSKQFDNEFAFAEDWQDCNLLWIPESGGKQEGTWASPRSILIWQSQEHVTSAIKVARLLNKRIVCLRENTCYYHFSEALVKLGCKHLSVQDIVDGLAALYQQKSPAHFYYLQNGNMVSPVGKEEFRALYSLLEYQLAKMLNFPTEYTQYLIMNWQWRSKEIPAAIQRNAQLMQLNLKDFPVMLIKDKVLPFQDIKHSLFLMYSSTLESIIRQTNTNINFADSSFVHNLPLSFAILRKKYIEAYATLTLVDFNSNREVYQPQASDIFAKVLEIDTIDVVQKIG